MVRTLRRSESYMINLAPDEVSIHKNPTLCEFEFSVNKKNDFAYLNAVNRTCGTVLRIKVSII